MKLDYELKGKWATVGLFAQVAIVGVASIAGYRVVGFWFLIFFFLVLAITLFAYFYRRRVEQTKHEG